MNYVNLFKLASDLSNVVNDNVKIIPFSTLDIYQDGLREESFDYIEKQLTQHGYNFKPIELALFYNTDSIFVQDGRHRLLKSKELGLDFVPAVLLTYNKSGYSKKSNVIIDLTS